MAEATARVASGLPGSTTTVATATAVSSTLVSSTIATSTLGAVPSNVTPLAALVALLTAASTSHGSSAVLGALAADVAGLTTAVAALLGLGSGAFTAQVTLVAAVVAGRVALAGAVGSTVGRVAAYKIKSARVHDQIYAPPRCRCERQTRYESMSGVACVT